MSTSSGYSTPSCTTPRSLIRVTPVGSGIDQVHVRQVEGRQVLVVERRPLASVGVIRLEGGRGLGVLHDGVHASPDLLHDPEVAVELLRQQLLGGDFTLVNLALLEICHLARQVVLVGLEGRAPGGDPGETGPPGPGPARLGASRSGAARGWSPAGRARRSSTACAGTHTGPWPPWPASGIACTAVAPVPMMPTTLPSRSML